MRCVECGYPKERHDADMRCPSGSKTYATMALPEGKACGDCRHFAHCHAMYGVAAVYAQCDFYPVRFIERTGVRVDVGGAP